MRKPELSQHFLKHPAVAAMLIGHSNVKKHDTVVDIGAGSGVVTTALAGKAEHVIALEPDRATAAKLRLNLAYRNIENVEIVERNVLFYNFPKTPYKVFSNPPFHISSDIIRKLIHSPNPPESIYLILQKQLALKLIATDRHYTSKLGEELNKMYTTRIRLPLKRQFFTPPPAVETVLFEAKKIPTELPTADPAELTKAA